MNKNDGEIRWGEVLETERKEKGRKANDIYWLIYGSLQKKNNEYGRKNV